MVKNNPVLIRNEEEEFAQVRRDLIFVISLNAIFFAVLFALYFLNRANGAVDWFFGHLLKF